MSDPRRERRARWASRLLDRRGRLRFPVSGWRQFQDWEADRARMELRELIADLSRERPLRVEAEDDGSVTVYPAEALN